MKKVFKFASLSLATIVCCNLVACSDKDEPDNNNLISNVIGFENVPAEDLPVDLAGTNLYYGTDNQITTGYLAQIYEDTYAQFSINYGLTYDAEFNQVWGYSFYNGGIVASQYHVMTGATYNNQMSVYNQKSPSGKKFAVAFGSGNTTNPVGAKLSDYEGCARVYITDAKGYTVADPGVVGSYVTGEDKEAYFKSVLLTNTTYTYLTMLNGNGYASALNEENQGWFKVQFIAFADNDPDSTVVGYTEAYLANFKEGQADDYIGIVDEWIYVDLSVLPECSILVINFVGSDNNEYGLLTPAYCALDKFVIEVEKD